MDKQSIRKQIRQTLKGAPMPDPEVVAQRISSLPEYIEAEYVFGYIALPSEVDVSVLMDMALRDGKTVAVPDYESGTFRIVDKNWRDHLTTLPNKTQTIKDSSILNIQETSANITPSNHIKGIILVPGLAFTEFGTRLGRGAGYYDQLLGLMEKSMFADLVSIGICRQAQLVKELPQQPHDRKVRMVIAF